MRNLKISKSQNLKTWTLALALALGLSSQAQTHLEAIPGRLDALYIHGNCSVDILRADRLALAYEHSFPYGESPFYQSGSRLIINDTAAHHYTLYYDRDTLPQLLLTLPGSQARIQTQGVVIAETKDIDQFYSSTSQAKVEQDTTPRIHLLDDLFPGHTQRAAQRREQRAHYSFADRTNLRLHWGLTNWTPAPLSGHFYNEALHLQTSPASIQLSATYALYMSEHWRFSLGLAYDWQRNRFVEPCVEEHYFNGIGPGGGTPGFALIATERPVYGGSFSEAGHYVTRLTFSYFEFPLTLAYSPLPHLEIGLTALPGLNKTDQFFVRSYDSQNRDTGGQGGSLNGSRWAKLDLRLDVTYRNVGLFLQTAVTPVYTDSFGTKAFPLKAGISLGF